MSQSLIPMSAFTNTLPSPPEASASWKTCVAHVIEAPDYSAGSYVDHVLGLRLSGTARAHQHISGRSVDGWLGPGGVVVMPAEAEFTWEERAKRGVLRGIALIIPREYIARVIAQDWGIDAGSVEIINRFAIRDTVIEGVMTRLAHEAMKGSPSGSMYAESACEFLAHHLVYAHSSLAAPPMPHAGGLPPRRLKLILEYIEENLAQPISLRLLAEFAGVSPRHFERAFRQALGVPPHAYVLDKRIETARHLLLGQPEMTISEVAAQLGFSSSSHFASAFRRLTGYSPRMFRRLYADGSVSDDSPQQ